MIKKTNSGQLGRYVGGVVQAYRMSEVDMIDLKVVEI